MPTKLYKDFKGMFNEMFSFKIYLVFLLASLAISIGLQMILPFPFGLAAALGIFIVFPLLLRKRAMSRMGGYGDSGTSGGFFGTNSGRTKVRYVCLVCNNKHNGGTCPRCGSKVQRADF
jgi:hypothetical protein